ncbi:MAG: hypothetical protein RLZZ397_1158 [Pseudomonadota bacterium]|jgi:hypothetical protein
MVFSMQYSTRQATADRWQSWLGFMLAACAWLFVTVSWGKDAPLQLVLQRPNQDVVITAQANLELPLGVRQALERSVSVAFVHQVVVRKPRWYWADREVSRKERLVRIQYQALTREWRVSVINDYVENGPPQSALHQSVSSLETALALASRVSEWEVASSEQVDGDKGLVLDYRFALDMGLMGRPFQMGAAGSADWSYQVQGSFKVPNNSAPVGDAATSEGLLPLSVPGASR